MNLRLADWPARLDAYLESARPRRFAWGVHDCGQFARGGVAALRGSDPAAALRLARYRTRAGAAAQLRRLGGIAAIPAACGLTPRPLPLAHRGDVVLHDFPGVGATLGLCLGRAAAFPGAHGLVFVPTLAGRCAWEV